MPSPGSSRFASNVTSVGRKTVYRPSPAWKPPCVSKLSKFVLFVFSPLTPKVADKIAERTYKNYFCELNKELKKDPAFRKQCVESAFGQIYTMQKEEIPEKNLDKWQHEVGHLLDRFRVESKDGAPVSAGPSPLTMGLRTTFGSARRLGDSCYNRIHDRAKREVIDMLTSFPEDRALSLKQFENEIKDISAKYSRSATIRHPAGRKLAPDVLRRLEQQLGKAVA